LVANGDSRHPERHHRLEGDLGGDGETKIVPDHLIQSVQGETEAGQEEDEPDEFGNLESFPSTVLFGSCT
jgi:hypothetical protein